MNSDWTAWMKHAIDTVSATVIIGALISALPAVAALGAFVWYCIQIYESRTVQHWVANKRMVHRAKKLAKLKAKEKIVAAEIAALEIKKQARRDATDVVLAASTEAAADVAHATLQAEKRAS